MLVLRQMVHYLDFSPNIVVVLLAEEFALRDGLAGVVKACALLGAEIRRSKLALPEFLADCVIMSEVLGVVRKNPSGFCDCCCRCCY